MDSLIRETNENLKAIIDNMKSNLDTSISTLENIQMQMDKKVEEAKKYKVQVDSAKEKIKDLEDSNKSLELSLKELSEKYGKMNLVSLVEAGNREIKTKINDNNREINKQKEHIADLTNKARTIKDLLINLKKDKTIKESRLENLKVVYEYYNERINDIIDYAFNHSENLGDYKETFKYVDSYEDINEEINNTDLENTMVFDEIANIDDNKVFKDEMTFIDGQIDEINDDKISELIKKNFDKYNVEENNEVEEVVVKDESLDSTQVFDSILTQEIDDNIEEDKEDLESDIIVDEPKDVINDFNLFIPNEKEEIDNELFISQEEDIDLSSIENEEVNNELFVNEDVYKETELSDLDFKEVNNVVEDEKKLDIFNIDDLKNNDEEEVIDTEDRINKINDLFSAIDNTKTSNINLNMGTNNVNGTIDKIDNAYMDIFGKPLEEDDINKKESTLTDIFGNPIKKEELSEEVKNAKKIEELFVENGIDFNKFKEDEQNYLKQIYDEDKFNNILNTLKRNKINLDNIYNSFNIFGEISANELESIISKLITCGQSVEAIGLVLEKLPKVKKYNLSDAIISYGDYIKDIDITDLIMKAKELYNGGNN